MRILFTCDLHGRTNLYDMLMNFAIEQDCECIIIGGDLFPTRISAPLKLLSGNADFNESLHVQLDFIDTFLVPVFDAFMKEHSHIHILYVPGNHDWKISIDHFRQCLPQAICMHNVIQRINGVSFMGYGCVTDSPFWVKDYVRRDTLKSHHTASRFPLISTPDGICVSENNAYAYENPSIEEELSPVSLADHHDAVCIFHCPPYDTGLDTLHDGKPIGSLSIRRYIEKHKPLVSLHGHIHESPYMSGRYYATVGETLSINPGYNSKDLHAVCFDTSDPRSTLFHRVFGKRSPEQSGLNNAVERSARKIKAYFMKTVLMK
ncbi:MAG: metallophosphoesterase [Deltaproteobacteria bacterium]|nr:metallophosphoesterase [Deltaproteobacteria bacterium]